MPRLPPSPVEESALARAFALASFAVAATAVVLYGQAYLVPPLAVAAAVAGHRASYRRRHRSRGRLRQTLIAGLVVACLVYFVADSVGAIFGGNLPQANFAMFLVAVTSFDLKTRRNLYSSIWIGLAVLYLAAVYAWDYQFGVLVLAWAACLVGFWTASNLARIQASLPVPGRRALAAAGAAVALALGLFWLLPQPSGHPDSPLVVSLPAGVHLGGEIENPALPLVQVAGDPSGAADDVNLRYRGRLGDAVVMYVRTGAPAYWRGLVFDRYAGGRWTASRAGYERFPPYVEARQLPAPQGPQLGTFVQTFRVTRALPGVVYAAQPVQSIYYPAAGLRRDAYGDWLAPGELRPNQTYSVVSSLPDYTPAALRAAAGEDDRDPATRDFSALSPRGVALARTVEEGVPADRYDQVMAIVSYLQQHYQYSLEQGHVPAGEDPVDAFLFGSRSGYCEQFATAAALMLRAVGIPTRLASGYATGAYDPVLDQSVVRERDAHAWVEAFFPGRGWVPVDPSPGYDPLAATRYPNRFAASGLARVLPHLTLGGGGAALTGLSLVGALPAILAVIAAAALAAAWIRRRGLPRLAWRDRAPPLIRLYERAQRGHRRRRPHQTPREYLAEVGESGSARGWPELTEAVERAVYAGRWPGPAELGELRANLRRQ